MFLSKQYLVYPLFLLVFSILPLLSKAQDNYEIQVYGSETVDSAHTMVELHSNYTFDGSKTIVEGVLPTNHVEHETIEITHGWTPWFETGFYFFNSIGNNGRTAYVGSHIRPRFAAPLSWNWPIGVSISLEYGFQKEQFSANTETLEIRPIIDKTIGKWYIAFNPTLDQSFRGPDEHRGLIYSPNVKISYNISKVIAIGPEYYGSNGPFFKYDPWQEQQQQIFVATDLNFSPEWEFNAGYGWGFTDGTDKAIFKVILGRRF